MKAPRSFSGRKDVIRVNTAMAGCDPVVERVAGSLVLAAGLRRGGAWRSSASGAFLNAAFDPHRAEADQ